MCVFVSKKVLSLRQENKIKPYNIFNLVLETRLNPIMLLIWSLCIDLYFDFVFTSSATDNVFEVKVRV